jgi:hypothetical protein
VREAGGDHHQFGMRILNKNIILFALTFKVPLVATIKENEILEEGK